MNLFTRWIKRINAGYVIAFTLLILGFVLTTVVNTRFSSQSGVISETDSTLDRLALMLTSLKSAQVSLGEYSLTKSYKSLNQYYDKRQKIDSLFSEIYHIPSVTAEQKSSMDTLGLLLNNLFANNSLNSQSQYRNNAARLLDSLKQNSIHNSQLVDSITEIIHVMQKGVQDKAVVKKKNLESLTMALKIIGLGMLLIALILAIHMLFIYNKERTAKRKARKEANEYHDQLEARVVELTKMNKEIIRLKSLEKFTTLGRVATSIAHDIKNPLTNINLATAQLNEDIRKEELKSFLAIIKRNSDKINEQVNHFLNVTAFATLQMQRISVNSLMDEILTETGDRINLEDIKVEKIYSKDICDVKVDIGKIKTALLNIVLNAIDAMEPGKGILKIHTMGKEDRCVVVIEDNGSGMDEETASKIFEPYYTTKKYTGSGLGLAHSQNIILNHNGNIEVESQPGVGTRFIVTLDFA